MTEVDFAKPDYLPQSSEHFIGRGDILDKMCNHFQTIDEQGSEHSRTILVLSGRGGSGKSQIVWYFVMRESESRFTRFYYLDASSLLTLRVSYAKIADVITGIPDDAESVVSYISALNEHWVLLVDGADDTTLSLQPFLPHGSKGSIIITTRRNPHDFPHLLGSDAEFLSITVPDLSNEEALHLLLNSSKQHTDVDTAVKLVQRLGRVALAISMASAYIDSTKGMTFERYIQLYQETESELLNAEDSKMRRMDSYNHPAYVSCEISLRKLSPDMMEVTRMYACMHPEGLARNIFFRAAPHERSAPKAPKVPKPPSAPGPISKLFGRSKPPPSKPVEPVPPSVADLGRKRAGAFTQRFYHQNEDGVWWTDPKMVNAVSDLMQKYSLLQRHLLLPTRLKHGSEFKLTRYTQSMSKVIREWLHTREPLVPLVQVAVGHLLSWSIPNDLARSNHAIRWQVLPHIERCYSSTNGLLDCPPIIHARFSALYADFKLRQAEKEILSRVIDHVETAHPAWTIGYETVLTNATTLAFNLKLGRKHEEAKTLDTKVLAAQRRFLGHEHQSTLTTLSHLGHDYSHELSVNSRAPRDDPRWNRPIELLSEAFEIQKRVLGEKSIHTLWTMERLSEALWSTTKQEQAEELGKELIRLRREASSSPTDSALLTSIQSLAWSYTATAQRHTDAEPLLLEVLQGRTQKYGVRNRQTAQTQGLLGLVCFHTQRYNEAEQYFRQARDVYVAFPATEISNKLEDLDELYNLARTYFALNRFAEAEECDREVLEKRMVLLQPNDPTIRQSLRVLALDLRQLGRNPEADELDRRARDLRR